MTRPKGAWVPDGKAKHLRAACEASLRALGVDAIDLYQLHVVDPRTPFETSVRTLAALKNEGKVKRVGLCNVTVGQIKAAREIVEVSAVQVSLSVLDDENLRNGVAEYCQDQRIRLIAHRPLGGVEKVSRLAQDPVLRDVAARRGVTAQDVALAWLLDLGVVPIPGATSVATAAAIERALPVRLSDADRQQLDAAFSGRLLRVPRAQRRPASAAAEGDVVLVMGMPAAGKSAVARELQALGYERLNRDERGGTLSSLTRALDAGLATGHKRWVLDNTYASRKSRNEVIECAWQHGVPVRCIHLTTSIADAQINAIARLVDLDGRLPTPEELRERGKDDPRYFGPDAQFRYERSVELPDDDEGFTAIERRTFARRANADAVSRALLLEYDDVLVNSSREDGPPHGADDVIVADGARDALQRLHGAGWLLFAHAWRPQIARGTLTPDSVEECFARTRELLGVDIALTYCPHEAGPPICWCRKPLPGLILEFALPRRVALERSIYVGPGHADRTLAQKVGVKYAESLASVEVPDA